MVRLILKKYTALKDVYNIVTDYEPLIYSYKADTKQKFVFRGMYNGHFWMVYNLLFAERFW